MKLTFKSNFFSLKNPDFAKRLLGKAKAKPMLMATVEALGNMGKEAVEVNNMII